MNKINFLFVTRVAYYWNSLKKLFSIFKILTWVDSWFWIFFINIFVKHTLNDFRLAKHVFSDLIYGNRGIVKNIKTKCDSNFFDRFLKITFDLMVKIIFVSPFTFFYLFDPFLTKFTKNVRAIFLVFFFTMVNYFISYEFWA